jgi:hypothetical protein
VSVDRVALFTEWQSRARQVGIDFSKPVEPIHRRDGARGSSWSPAAAQVAAEGARRSVRYAIAHLTERQAIIRDGELLDVALKHAVGRATLRDVVSEVERLG